VAPERPVVAVFGLAPGCGATVAARALAVELALRDAGTAVVACERPPSRLVLGTGAAIRLARRLAAGGGGAPLPAGRLCLVEAGDHGALARAVRPLAPLVLDAGRVAVGGAPAAVADAVVLTAPPDVEPGLVAAVAASVERTAVRPLLAIARGAGAPPEADAVLPDSRLGARLALAGHEPRGALGAAAAALADRVLLSLAPAPGGG
jgi:hypothetical protein